MPCRHWGILPIAAALELFTDLFNPKPSTTRQISLEDAGNPKLPNSNCMAEQLRCSVCYLCCCVWLCAQLPASLEKCLKALGPLTPANINKAIDCNNKFGGRENYQSSILALDLDSGRVR